MKTYSELKEGKKFTPKQIKMAIGVASDKRYAGNNFSGAVEAIDKIAPGLSDHPQVAAVLKRQNEETITEKRTTSSIQDNITERMEGVLNSLKKTGRVSIFGVTTNGYDSNEIKNAKKQFKNTVMHMEQALDQWEEILEEYELFDE